jgi:transposase
MIHLLCGQPHGGDGLRHQVAVRLVTGGQSIAAVARFAERGGADAVQLGQGVKAERHGKLEGADRKVVSVEHMEISRLRAELARVKMERDILGKATVHLSTSKVSAAGKRWSTKKGPQFVEVPAPTDQALQAVLHVTRRAARR